MPGRSYSVNGHLLHLDCTGSGSPTVVLENGLGLSSPAWALITEGVGTQTRVCAYDRAGQGWSEDPAQPQDGRAVADDLHALLATAGEEGPFVLAGHSAGGAYAMTYAATYPGRRRRTRAPRLDEPPPVHTRSQLPAPVRADPSVCTPSSGR